jgi:hypothetical protein
MTMFKTPVVAHFVGERIGGHKHESHVIAAILQYQVAVQKHGAPALTSTCI